MSNLDNEPRNHEYQRLKIILNSYLKNKDNNAMEALRDNIISGEEIIYLLEDYSRDIENMKDSIDSILNECDFLTNDLEESLKNKTGTFPSELNKIIEKYKKKIKEELINLKKYKASSQPQ